MNDQQIITGPKVWVRSKPDKVDRGDGGERINPHTYREGLLIAPRRVYFADTGKTKRVPKCRQLNFNPSSK